MVSLGVLFVAIGCGATSVRDRPSQRSSRAAASDTSPVASDSLLFVALSRVERAPLPVDLAGVCDTVGAILDANAGRRGSREDGTFADSFRGEKRLGCRLIRIESEGAPDSAGADSRLSDAFEHRGFAQDLRYTADGPDASDTGMRRRDILCLMSVRTSGSDDDDTVAVHPPPRSDVGVMVECVRDVSSNADAGVTDSLWRLAEALGMDSVYAIDFRLQTPPYLSGDFDGDGVDDAAVLITERRTGKLGVAFLLRGAHKVIVVGAGRPPQRGPDDFSWINSWDVFSQFATLHLTIPDRPSAGLRGDALWLAHRDSASGFLSWSGDSAGTFQWDARRPR